jgi:predicted HNH restriction endonuclease
MNDRDQISAAMERLLAGTPRRSSGQLTVVSLAEEAGVKRHVLTHKHPDLKDQFYARVRAQNHATPTEQKLRAELETERRKRLEVTTERDQLKRTVEDLTRVVQVLTVENDQLRSTDRSNVHHLEGRNRRA